MLSADARFALFLAAYLGKVTWLGREALSRWSPAARALLRFHEACIAVFLLAGACALVLAWRNRLRHVGARTPTSLARAAQLHRRAGWTTLVASALGVLSASGVLWGMFARAS
jgi:divalent metal cation (Fe/Co/Zn/Cd) transporter